MLQRLRSQHGAALLPLIIGVIVVIVIIVLLYDLITGRIGVLPFSFSQPQGELAETEPTTEVTVINTPEKIVVNEGPPPASSGPLLEEIINGSEQYVGQRVEVTGLTEERVEPWGFTIKPSEDSNEEMLVMVVQDITQQNPFPNNEVPSNQAVKVTGTIKILSTELEEQFGFEPDDLSVDPWINDEVLVAETIEEI